MGPTEALLMITHNICLLEKKNKKKKKKIGYSSYLKLC